MGKTEDQVLRLLENGTALTLKEIAEKLGVKPKTVFRSIRKLFEEGKIYSDPKTSRYALEKEVR